MCPVRRETLTWLTWQTQMSENSEHPLPIKFKMADSAQSFHLQITIHNSAADCSILQQSGTEFDMPIHFKRSKSKGQRSRLLCDVTYQP